MRINNNIVASKISKKTCGISKTIEDHCYRLLIEEIFIPKDVNFYEKNELKQYIVDYFNKNNIKIKGEKFIYDDQNDIKYLNHFIEDENSTWNELAKELCKIFPNEIEDFIWCLLKNLDEENKLEAINMVCNMKI